MHHEEIIKEIAEKTNATIEQVEKVLDEFENMLRKRIEEGMGGLEEFTKEVAEFFEHKHS